MKNTDVVAFSEHGHYAVIEVKTSSVKRFVTGLTSAKIQNKHKHVFWVLVSVQQDQKKAQPRYFVLSDLEIKGIQERVNNEYCERYRIKHGKEFTGKGVPGFPMKEVILFEDEWGKIDAYLESIQKG